MIVSSHIPSKIQWRFFLGRVFLGWKKRKAGGLRVVLVQVQPWEKWVEGAKTARGIFWLPSKGFCLCRGLSSLMKVEKK